ncbi:MAG: coproporphyrinogen-III oxidase family protein [Faecalibacterium sp.]
MSLGLYLHIPYCFSKCRYCDFYSAPGQRGVPRAYVDALLRELSRFAPDAPLRPDTLYFGGGTPSLLAPADAARLIDAAQPLPGAEITLEANPETVTEASLRAFRAAGVNRISFGVQSARDSQLKTLGRPHTAKQARAAFAAARRAGFENISGDIMLALPHYTQAEFDETLELIEEGGATHISAYLLKIEPDSAFGRTPPRVCPPPTRRRTSTSTPSSSWSTTGICSTRSRTLPAPAMRGSTTSSTGTAATIWASAPPPTPAWAANGSTTRPTPRLSCGTRPRRSWTAAAGRKIISSCNSVSARA